MKESSVGAVFGPLISHFKDLRRAARHALCRITGHQRMRSAVHPVGDAWYSWCERCQAKLVRVSPKNWRALTPEELSCQSTGRHAGDHVSAIPLPADTKPTVVATPNAGHGDREKAAGRQGYSVAYFARKHGITRQQAEELIARIGDDRDKLNAAAERLGKPVLVNAARD